MKGILAINGVKLNVVHFTNGIYTDADATGRPWGKPKGGIFSVVIPMTKDNSGITRAALHDTLKVDGNITFYQWDFGKVFSKLEFANAHIIHYSEHYDHQSNEAPIIQLTFSPGIQRLNNDTIFEKPWNPNNPFKDVQTPTPTVKEVIKKKEPSINSMYFADATGNIIPNNELKSGAIINLIVKTSGAIGEIVDINLDDNSNDFKYKGEALTNDILENLTIESDTQKVELEILSQKK